MLEIELKSRELKEFLYLKLDKRNDEALYDTDLDEITELDLNCIDLVGEKNDVTIEDIVFFKNLKSLYISNFSLGDKSIQLINSRNTLEFIQINNCYFKNEIPLSLNVKHIAIIDSDNIDFSKINESNNLEKIHIVGCSNVNYEGITKFKNLKKVYLQNMDLDDVNEITELPNLVYLNLNGSNIADSAFNKKDYDFIIEHEPINTVFDSEN